MKFNCKQKKIWHIPKKNEPLLSFTEYVWFVPIKSNNSLLLIVTKVGVLMSKRFGLMPYLRKAAL